MLSMVQEVQAERAHQKVYPTVGTDVLLHEFCLSVLRSDMRHPRLNEKTHEKEISFRDDDLLVDFWGMQARIVGEGGRKRRKEEKEERKGRKGRKGKPLKSTHLDVDVGTKVQTDGLS
jgi:hypothetical protein